MHGTPAHLDAHADLAGGLGLAAGRIRNGHVLRIGAQVEVIASVPTGRLRRVRGAPTPAPRPGEVAVPAPPPLSAPGGVSGR